MRLSKSKKKKTNSSDDDEEEACLGPPKKRLVEGSVLMNQGHSVEFMMVTPNDKIYTCEADGAVRIYDLDVCSTKTGCTREGRDREIHFLLM